MTVILGESVANDKHTQHSRDDVIDSAVAFWKLVWKKNFSAAFLVLAQDPCGLWQSMTTISRPWSAVSPDMLRKS
jgi:hypothetical protein